MADGVTLDPGAGGDKIATDDLGATGHVQWVKLRDGTDGGTEVIAGDTANGLDVDVTRVGGDVTVVDGGGSLTVDNATISVVGGGAEATAQRVTIASDSTGVLSVDDNGSTLSIDDGGGNISIDDGGNSITVDGSVSADTELTTADLDTGVGSDTRAVVGLVKAKSGGAVNISDTDPLPVSDAGGTLSVDDGAGSLTVDNPTISVVGSGTEATAQRVTIATDSTGVLSVDDNGSTLSVDDGAGSLTVDAPVGTPAFVRLSDGSSAIATLPVSLATVPSHAVTNAGTFAVQVDGSALTALQLIDDTVFADDAAFTTAVSKVNVIGLVADETSTDSVDEGDVGAPRMTLDRKQITTVAPSATTEGLSIFRTLDADETEEDVKTSAGKLYGWFLQNNASSVVYVKFYNATAANTTVGSTTPIMTVPIPANAAANVEFTNGIAFSTALCIAATTGVGDADTTAPAANQVVANVFYK